MVHKEELKLSLKTRMLNIFRAVFKHKFLEQKILPFTQNKPIDALVAKIIPNNYQYQRPSWRTATRQGITFTLDISDYMDYCIYYGLKNEPRQILYDLVNDGSIILDIGTNIGETLLNFARINKTGVNYGFEPVPVLYERACHNIRQNNFTNIKLHQLALSDKDEELHFHQPTERNSGSVFMRKGEDGDAASIVKATTLDNFVQRERIDHIELIKMDVEGFEYTVIQGGLQTLSKYKPFLFIEINELNLLRQGRTAKELFETLLSMDYKIYHAETGEQLDETYDFNGKHFDIIAKQN